jgi:hypothetical protein
MPAWWGDMMSSLQALTPLAALIAAILAWLAKLRWSKEFAAAKDEAIKAKDAEIAALKTQISRVGNTKDEVIKAKDPQLAVLDREIQNFRDITPMKLKEYVQTTKEMLEDCNNALQKQLIDS